MASLSFDYVGPSFFRLQVGEWTFSKVISKGSGPVNLNLTDAQQAVIGIVGGLDVRKHPRPITGPLTVVSADPTIASAVLADDSASLTIVGLATGVTTVTLTDLGDVLGADGHPTSTVNVTVTDGPVSEIVLGDPVITDAVIPNP